jgi:hypothetical protein
MPESVKTRPTRSHEQVFLFAKSQRYFYDWFSVLEKANPSPRTPSNGEKTRGRKANSVYVRPSNFDASGGRPEKRNLRTVWTLSNEPYKGAHFATFPTKLVTPCIKAGTSEKGCCPRCGAQWIRQVEKQRVATRPGVNSKVYITPPVHPDSPVMTHAGDICGNRDPQRHVTRYVHKAWEPTCRCGIEETIPCRVLDPFSGVGTTALVAENLGRIGISLELGRQYCEMARDRVLRPHKEQKPKREKPSPLFDRS